MPKGDAKRGQVTIFIIAGIIVLLAIAFLFFARGKISEAFSSSVNVEKQTNQKMREIQGIFEKCIVDEGSKVVFDFMKNGGSFGDMESYLEYHTEKIRFLCQPIADSDGCMASPLVVSKIEKELGGKIGYEVGICAEDKIRAGSFDVSYDINSISANVSVADENILVNVVLPVTVSKGDFSLKKDLFSERVNVKLKRIIDGVNDVLASESRFGGFDATGYNKDNIRGVVVNELQVNSPNRAYDVYVVDWKQSNQMSQPSANVGHFSGNEKLRFGVRDEI